MNWDTRRRYILGYTLAVVSDTQPSSRDVDRLVSLDQEIRPDAYAIILGRADIWKHAATAAKDWERYYENR